MKDRIKTLMDRENLTPSAFADRLGIGRAVISHILTGRNNPSLDVVTQILNTFFYVNSEWLMTGQGVIDKRDKPEEYTNVNRVGGTFVEDKDIGTEQTDLFSQNMQTNSKSETTNEANISKQTNTQPIKNAPPEVHQESKLSETDSIAAQYSRKQLDIINAAQQVNTNSKKVVKIIIYYNDNTFETFESDNRPL